MFGKLTALIIMIMVFLFICSTVSADVIHLKDGRKVEGTIVTKDANKVSIQTKFGIVEFAMSEVKSIEEKKTKDQLYEEMLENAGDRDTTALMKLVKWCKENRMSSKANKHLKQIIGLDPNHAEAREMLGYVKYEGGWVTKKEREKLAEEAEAKEKEAAGLVKYNGEWLPKEDVEKLKSGLVKYEGNWVSAEEKERLEKNLVLYEGEWIPVEDAEKRKQGLFKIDDNWVKKEEADRYHSNWETPWRLQSEHLLFVTNLPYDMVQKFLAEGEGAYKSAKSTFGVEPNLTESKMIVFLLSDLDTYNAIGNQIGADQKSSYYSVYVMEESPEVGSIAVTYFINESFTFGLVRHAVCELYFKNLELKEALPDWYIKGFAAYRERFFHSQYISWSKKTLITQGGPIKLKQFFGNFGYTEREILHSGLLVGFLESNDVPDSVKDRMADVVAAVKANKKIAVAFAKLETLLVKSEKQFLAFYDKFK